MHCDSHILSIKEWYCKIYQYFAPDLAQLSGNLHWRTERNGGNLQPLSEKSVSLRQHAEWIQGLAVNIEMYPYHPLFSNASKSCYGKTLNFKADIILFSGCQSIIQTFIHFTIKGFLFHKWQLSCMFHNLLSQN